MAVIAAVMMMLGISNSAYAVQQSPTGEIVSATDGLISVDTVEEIRAGGASGGVEAEVQSAAVPFTCQVNSPSYNGASQWDTTGSPAMLAGIVWTGSGIASCTIPMASITYNAFTIDPQGIPHPIATGSCAGCPQVTTTNAGYACVQGATIATNCAGGWQVSYQAVITAPPGETFSSGSGSCVATGTVLRCSASAVVGVAPLFAPSSTPCTPAPAAATPAHHATYTVNAACYNYPPSGNVQLSLGAIKDMRDTHFPGGPKVDNSKGLFLTTVTNRDLAKILDTGLQDSGPWVLNANNYYEKTFPYSGVGTKSPQAGGGPSNTITLVVAKFANDYDVVDVITMYPANA